MKDVAFSIKSKELLMNHFEGELDQTPHMHQKLQMMKYNSIVQQGNVALP